MSVQLAKIKFQQCWRARVCMCVLVSIKSDSGSIDLACLYSRDEVELCGVIGGEPVSSMCDGVRAE